MRKFAGMLYFLYSVAIFFVLMVVVCPFIMLAMVVFNEKTGKRFSFFFLKCWAWGFSMLTCLWFTAQGKSHIDTSRSYIYIGNHGSFLDAVAIVICIPQAFSPLGKIEM